MQTTHTISSKIQPNKQLLIFLIVVLASLYFAFQSSSLFSLGSVDAHEKQVPNENEKWDSAKSVVIGLAVGYNIHVYKRFIGSLRATGYSGQIILGVSPNQPLEVTQYLAKHKVTLKLVETGPCANNTHTEEGLGLGCLMKYPDYKPAWGRIPLAHDWLLQCEECTDGVMLTDVRDAYFQADPFRFVEDPHPIMLIEEIAGITTSSAFTHEPVAKCRKTNLLQPDGPTQPGHPMLNSGSTMGSREGILRYLSAMKKEMDYWVNNCQSFMELLAPYDQSIHNYLFYNNQLEGAVVVPHRTGAIHVVGGQAAGIFNNQIKAVVEKGFAPDYAGHGEMYVVYHGFRAAEEGPGKDHCDRDWWDWLGHEDLGLVDPNTGNILNLDGKPSPQVHQYDRFGRGFEYMYVNRMSREVWNKE